MAVIQRFGPLLICGPEFILRDSHHLLAATCCLRSTFAFVELSEQILARLVNIKWLSHPGVLADRLERRALIALVLEY